MKNHINYIGILSLLLCSCQLKDSTALKVDKEGIKKEINEVMDNWHLAAAQANFDTYFGIMDSVSVFIGTDASENWTKTEFMNFSKPYFDAGKAWSFAALERSVYANSAGNLAWFDELLATWMGTCRGSGVLERNGNEWKLKHYVLSVAIPNDDVQKVIEVKQKNDSIFLSKYR